MEANRRLNLDPDDSEARRIVGRAAYNAGRFRLAAWHYGQLVERFPADHHARLRLAWAERRQGLHRNELDHYEVILNRYPGHALALSGKSMAAARLGRFVEAQALVEQLHVVAPTHPYTDVTSAVLEAVRGQDNDALRSIRRAVEGRDRLDEELQVELRRDIATDPAFLPLRNHWRLRAVLRRHFAAASPRGTK
jgi:tetratricopeptide (TPR) repeat protein